MPAPDNILLTAPELSGDPSVADLAYLLESMRFDKREPLKPVLIDEAVRTYIGGMRTVKTSCHVFLCALQLFLSTSAFAQDTPVTDCDTYAASDQDPQRRSVGVPFDKINPSLAVPACEAAVREYPNSTRLVSQLGRAYHKANNLESAVAQYRKAGDQGNVLAQTNLGVMYSKGEGVPQDPAQAVAWLRKAADQGNAKAQGYIGWMYLSGYGVPQDYSQALAWLRKAADQGNAEAQGYIDQMKHDWRCGTPAQILDVQIQGDGARINNLSLNERESFGGGLRVIEFQYSIVNRRDKGVRVNAELAGFDSAGNIVIALRAGPMMDMVGAGRTETAHGDTYASEGELRKIQKLCVRFVGDF